MTDHAWDLVFSNLDGLGHLVEIILAALAVFIARVAAVHSKQAVERIEQVGALSAAQNTAIQKTVEAGNVRNSVENREIIQTVEATHADLKQAVAGDGPAKPAC